MTEKRFKLVNTLTGWAVFLVAAITYLLTIEPTVSFWDCGEFISSSNKLQIGHPPGAPFFMIIARFFAIFASGPEQVAMMINSMSALASAFTILFLFWTITFLAKRLIAKDKDYTVGNTIAIMACSAIGALAYTFTDSFWFSAVEGEVYAFSSFFTAIVFWAITKWYEDDVNDVKSRRWILLIALLMGMSIGVHLLNLLTLPAIAFVVYYRKYKPTFLGFVITTAISLLAIAVIMWGIIPGVAVVASKFELLFTNSFGMPFNTGLIIWVIITLICLVLSIYFSHKSNSVVLNTIFPTLSLVLTGAVLFAGNVMGFLITIGIIVLLAMNLAKKHREIINYAMLALTVIIIGYSSFAIVVIRSNANPPMDQNNPEDMFNLLSYLNREQYGDRPLLYGQDFNSRFEKYENTTPVYTRRDGKYALCGYRSKPVFKSQDCRFFPRMHSRDESHIAVYKDFGGMKKSQKKPTGLNNIQFFINYQMNWMYWRYFLWNFAGRQNDIQGHGNTIYGNWISGFDALDNARLGDQSLLPDTLKENKAHNKYYMLPLFLGLIGLFYQLWKNVKDWWIVSLLFILTGIAIVVYLNQTPIQPRERDYSYAGSFYAFAIWIGLGVAALYELFKKFTPSAVAGIVALVIALPVPTILAQQNWDDHDRSNRYVALDFAKNYLETCAPNAILFTHGDNDTFPIWYAQEVEGVRPDVKVCCLPYFASDWYIDQMKCASYDAAPMPLSIERSKYEPNVRDQIFLMKDNKEFLPIDKFISELIDDKNKKKMNGETYYIIPASKISIPASKEQILKTQSLYPGYTSDTADYFDTVLNIDLNREYLMKNEMMILDLISTNNWERPIYITSIGSRNTMGLDNYFHNEGFAFRLMPVNKKAKAPEGIVNNDINTDVMYENLMNKYSWGNLNDPNVYIDPTITRTMNIVKIRANFGELAKSLIKEGKTEEAKKVMARCEEVMPTSLYPIDLFDCHYVEAYYMLGMNETADKILKEGADIADQELTYFSTLDRYQRAANNTEIQMCLATIQYVLQIFDENQREELFQTYYSVFFNHRQWYD